MRLFAATGFVFALFIATLIDSAPVLQKRIFLPSSPVFSLIAHHKGAVFQYNLVKYDDDQLLLNADETAFFGRIKAHNGYVLNIPDFSNSTYNSTVNSTTKVPPPSTTNIEVNKNHQLVIAKEAKDGSPHFGITNSKLTYHNSSSFLACPDHSYRSEYQIYWDLPRCPNNSSGYDIDLLVQINGHINYDEYTNN